MGSIAKDEREERMVWETQSVPTTSMSRGRPVFRGGLACPQMVPTNAFCRLRRREVKSKRKRRDLSSPGILAKGSTRQQSTSGGSKCASVKTGTQQKSSGLWSARETHRRTHTHPAAERHPSASHTSPSPPPLPLSAVNIRAGTEVTTAFFHRGERRPGPTGC